MNDKAFYLQRLRASFLGILFLFCGSILVGADSPTNENIVRLASVNTPVYSGLLETLIAEFEAKTNLQVELFSGEDVYDVAMHGQADIVISHYGKPDVEGFVMDGFGFWPVMVFANQAVIIGPEADPADVRNAGNAVTAFERIEAVKANYVINQIHGVTYLGNILMELAEWPGDASWLIDEDSVKAATVKLAEQNNGYTIWGAMPFLKWQSQNDTAMEILVSDDPIFQRIMASVIVNPDRIEGVNVDGAQQFQDFLLAPRTQAMITNFRVVDYDGQLWWPAGRDN